MKVFNSQISHPYIDVVKESLEKSLNYESQLTPFVLDVHGMSGKKYRHFINNVVSSISDARYLEVGSWKGSTLCAAIFNNNVTAYTIDDWSTDGGPKDGTNRAIKELNLEVLYSVEIDSSEDYGNGLSFQRSDWHNGYFIGVLKKKIDEIRC